MKRASRGVPFLLLLLLGTSPVHAEESAPTAQQYLDAYRAADEAAMDAVVRRLRHRTFLVADGLFTAHVRGTLEEPPAPRDYLACLRDFATRTERLGATWNLSAWLERVAALEREDLERYEALRKLSERVETVYNRRNWTTALQEAKKFAARGAAEVPSVAPFQIAFHRGKSLAALGRIPDAVASLLEAATRAEGLGWVEGVTIAWNEAAHVARNAGAALELQTLEDGIAALDRVGHPEQAWRLECALLVHLGYGTQYDGALRRARALGERAHERGDRRVETVALTARVAVLLRQGRFTEADRLEKQVLARLDDREVREYVPQLLMLLATMHSKTGRLARALHLLDGVFTRTDPAPAPDALSTAWAARGSIYRRMGRYPRALACYDEAMAFARRDGDGDQEARILGNVGNVWMCLEEYDRAYRVLEAALARKRALQDLRGIPTTILGMATALGNQDAAAPAVLELAQQALEAAQGFGQWEIQLGALRLIALHQESRGDLAKGLETRRRALDALESQGLRTGFASLLYAEQARNLLAADRPSDAVTAARRSLDIQLLQSRGLGEIDAFTLRRRTRRAADVGLCAAWRLATEATTPHARAPFDAYALAEASRALHLADAIRSGASLLRAELAPELLHADHSSRAQLENAREVAERVGGDREAGTEDVRRARDALDAAWAHRRDVVARIQREARRVSALVYPEPASVAAIQDGLPEGSALVLYHFGQDDVWAVLVSRRTVSLFRLGAADAIRQHARRYLKLVSLPDVPESAAAAGLYDLLLRPLEATLEGCDRLFLSPDDVLAFVPFAALLRTGDPRSERALERWTMTLVPSGTILLGLLEEATARGSGLIAIGDPDYGDGKAAPLFEPLPGSRAEVQAIAKLFPPPDRTVLVGRDASVDGLVAALAARTRRLSALHVACHAVVDVARPELSGLALAGGRILDVDRIHALRARSDLVVLSACETARGAVAEGEGVLGLVRGFMFAGAPRVIATNWRIDDASARGLMTRFYEHFVREDVRPSTALRRAQLERLRAGGAEAHPYHWAAYVLWGLP